MQTHIAICVKIPRLNTSLKTLEAWPHNISMQPSSKQRLPTVLAQAPKTTSKQGRVGVRYIIQLKPGLFFIINTQLYMVFYARGLIAAWGGDAEFF